MPDIDVTDVVLDGHIAGESFLVERRLQTVNDFGESTTTTVQLGATGAVSPTGDNSIIREQAFQTQAKTIRVITTFDLRGPTRGEAGKKFDADVVLWRGGRFVVAVVNDYSQYGQGFIEAECMNMLLADLAPGVGIA